MDAFLYRLKYLPSDLKNILYYYPRSFYFHLENRLKHLIRKEYYVSPVFQESGTLSKLPRVPYFVYQRDKNYSDEQADFEMILGKLRDEDLYQDGLIFCGFKGIRLFKEGSFGKRNKTFAVTEKMFRNTISRKWRHRKLVNSPFLHMDCNGGRMPALAVFDSSKLVNGEFFYDEAAYVRHGERNCWWTKDESSLDSAAVAVFFFKQKNMSDQLFPLNP